MANKEIREAMKRAGVAQWELGDLLECSENTVYRKLRKELPEDMKQKILKLIEDYQHRGLPHDEKNIEKV